MAATSFTQAYTALMNQGVSQVTISDDLINKLEIAATESSFRSSGAGSYLSTWQMVTSQFDRMGYNPMIPNHEKTGLVFFTRPKLNLMGSSLRQDRVMATMDTFNSMGAQDAVRTLPFSIRCYLDSNFATWSQISDMVENCPFVNNDTPFIVPLTNQISTMTGWPSFDLGHDTLATGFYGENQTIARGSDFNNRTYDLSISFRDFQGGYISAMFLYWIRFIALVCRGDVVPYSEDNYYRRLCYTCSIYRFVLDPSKRFITKWAKATGCFPYSHPIGSVFDITQREAYVTAAQDVNISFVANHVEYMDPIIFQDFNTLIGRWAGDPFANRSKVNFGGGDDNFKGIPYIDTQSGTNELLWLAKDEELLDPADLALQNIQTQIDSQLRAQASALTPIQSVVNIAQPKTTDANGMTMLTSVPGS